MDPGTPVTLDTWQQVQGPFFHGTKAVLSPGDELVPGHRSNFQQDRVMNHIYFSTVVETAVWGAELAAALVDNAVPGRVYEVVPTGPFEDDPNVTDKRFPGNPTRSYRSRHALRVVREVPDWPPHPPEVLTTMLEGLAALREQGKDLIID